ncbi:MAG: ParA family protein [Pelolinea sp.]|nr:ParA family protein [Pelolinea sp.]
MLLIDFDPQANVTKVFINNEDEIPLQRSIYNALLNFYPLENIIQETQTKNLFLAPSHIRLSGTDLELSQAMDNRSERLKRAIEPIIKQYDYIIIDTPPALGLLTINALAASEKLIIPVSTGFFALTGLVQLQETIAMVKQTKLNQDLEILGVLCTFYERTNVSRDVEKQLRDYFGGQVFKTTIPKNISLEEAHSNHTHVFGYAPKSQGADAYKALVKEVLAR